MAGSAGTEDYNAAGNSDFSRKAMALADQMLGSDWAAPQARDHFPAHSPDYVAAKKAEGHGMRNLNDEAATWRAPSDLSKRGGSQAPEERQAGGHSVNLEDQAEHWAGPMTADSRGSAGVGKMELPNQARAWPGPQARDHKGVKQSSQLDYNARPLNEVASHFVLPSSPDPETAAGAMSSIDGPNSNQPSVRRKLNPIFVEALMRWPTGLSGFARPETELIQWRQRMLTYLSALCSPAVGQRNLCNWG